ncbi:MAG: NAD(P)-dependent oxidoreductase [Bryobacterales bacterium]|nr:NAD(P)-dependent oxidoreductase [Bryobacterales bacterium]
MPGEIAILGGTGFIGSALVAALRKRGYRLKVVSRRAGPERNRTEGVTYVRGDVGDASSMLECLRDTSVVFHLATGGGNNWAAFERDFVQGARNVANACLAYNARRLIYTSSVAALYLGGTKPVDESAGTDTKPGSRSHYSRAKILAESVLQQMHHASGLPLVVVRPALVAGRGGMLNHSGVGFWPSSTCCTGWGRGKTPLPFVLVEDVAEALVLAMETPGIEGRSFNLAGPIRPSAAEFMEMVRKRSRRNFRFYPQSLLKMQMIEILKWAVKCAARKRDNAWPSFRDLKSRSLRAQLDSTAAERILGWSPTTSTATFLAEAIDSHLQPLLAGDLRCT